VFSDIWASILGFLEGILAFFHDIVVPVFGEHSWGWAIVLLTLLMRVLLLPLAIKQTRSMRSMQAIQPKMKELQKKYKVDRELMRKDPEKYRAKKQKLNEEMMALYQEEGVNPAASCLPLVAQAPVFIALFWTIRGMEVLENAPFYFFTDFISNGDGGPTGLGALVSNASWPGWLLIVVMSGTMFLTQKQMMARTAATGSANPMAQQQKILLYVMPLFLAFVSFNFPLGLLLYWVTTNIWQVAQQWIILREVRHEAETGELKGKKSGGTATPGKGGATSGKGGKGSEGDVPDPTGDGKPAKGSKPVEGADDTPPAADGVGGVNGSGPKDATPSSNGNHGSEEGSERPSKKGGRARPEHLPRRGGKRD
jgi:YidC/Oxa1 family membrane protein insertase